MIRATAAAAAWPRTLGVLLLAATVSCTDGLLVSPASAPGARLVIAYTIGAAGSAAAGDAAAFDQVNRLQVQLVRETGIDLDVTLPFTPTGAVTQVPIEVAVTEDDAFASLLVQLRRDDDPLFLGSQAVNLKRGETQNVEIFLVPVPAGVRVPASVRTLTTIGDTVRLHGAVIFATGDTIADYTPIWFSNNTAIADVSPTTGLVTARGSGQTQIRGDFGGFSASVPVTVQLGSGPGTIVGRVVNATNGVGIAGATIGLASGANAPPGSNFVVSTTTQTDGSYALSANTGQYTILARAQGFLEGRITGVTVQGGQQTFQVALSPTIGQGQTRIVLTWGATPADLDAHLTGPTASGQFHVYFGSPGSLTAPPFAALDTDALFGFGPETITIGQQAQGVYRFSVHDFTNQLNPISTALGTSGAIVTIFQSGGQVAQFRVPAGAGTLWTVFELNGGTITPINTLSTQQPPGNVIDGAAAPRPAAKLTR